MAVNEDSGKLYVSVYVCHHSLQWMQVRIAATIDANKHLDLHAANRRLMLMEDNP